RPHEPAADLGGGREPLRMDEQPDLRLGRVEAPVPDPDRLNVVRHGIGVATRSAWRRRSCRSGTAPPRLSYTPGGSNQCRRRRRPAAAGCCAAGGSLSPARPPPGRRTAARSPTPPPPT